ncbi:MAG TPA: LysM peptidoglycan-binding domain-containing protein [Thermoanaerobaculia bacterium]|nr:LysM peptidoglycan-binding domain-containing protein [Thermoanaerobaculia bacterium]
MRVRLSGFILATLLLPLGALRGADRPPHNLHLEGDHWTAWNPPAPDAGTQTYTIVRGDTLWDLARRYYGNPYLWPQLWEKNQYIRDAHWIYPGDPLVTGIKVAPVESLAAVSAVGAAGSPALAPPQSAPEPEAPAAEKGATGMGMAAKPPVPLGAESDIYCSGFIGDRDEAFPYAIVGSEYEVLTPKLIGDSGKTPIGIYGVAETAKFDLSTGDIVYIGGGQTQGLAAGKLLTIVASRREVVHPVQRGVFGRYYQYLGRLRVLSVQESGAIAEIVHSCDAIRVGARLLPFEPEPVPLGRPTGMRPVNLPATVEKLKDAPVILFARDDIVTLGQDHMVFIDRGADQELTPGDVFTIYRMNRPGLPPIVLGELAVLSVQKRSALAKITESRYPIYVGDRLDPK